MKEHLRGWFATTLLGSPMSTSSLKNCSQISSVSTLIHPRFCIKHRHFNTFERTERYCFCRVLFSGFLSVFRSAKTLRSQLKIGENTKIISYLGSLEERKNPLAVLKVAAMLQERKDIHFVIAGKGDSDYSRQVIETAK